MSASPARTAAKEEQEITTARMYVQGGLAIETIGRRLGISSTVIRRNLKACGIPMDRFRLTWVEGA